jgi:hypothetical protein
VRRMDKVLLAGIGLTVATLLIAGAVNPQLAITMRPAMGWIAVAAVIRFALWPRDKPGRLKEPPEPDPPTPEDVLKGQVAWQRMKILTIAVLIPSTAATVFVVASKSENPVVSATLPLAITVGITAIWQFTPSPLTFRRTQVAAVCGWANSRR